MHQPEESEPLAEDHTKMPLQRSQRERKLTLSNDYVVYLYKLDYNIGQLNQPMTFDEDFRERKW